MRKRSLENDVATICHELRQPLSVIRTATRLMDEAVSPEAKNRARDVINRQTDLLARLADDILTLFSTGALSLQRQTVDCRDLVAKILAGQRPFFSAAGITLDSKAPLSPVMAAVDVDRLNQVLSNMLENAMRHVHRGGNVWVRVEAENGWVRLVVRDDGCGIDSRAVGDVFGRFVQGTTGRVGRSGLGLWVVKTLVELHGGNVAVASEGRGRGTQFVVAFPNGLADEQVSAS